MNVRRLFTQENRLAEKKGNCGFRSLKRLPVARLLLQLNPENVSIHGTGPLRLKWTAEQDFLPTFLSRDNRAAAEWTTHNATLRRDNLPRPICRRRRFCFARRIAVFPLLSPSLLRNWGSKFYHGALSSEKSADR